MGDTFSINLVIGVLAGMALAAATGFRVFIPMLLMSLAVRADMVQLSDGFAWLGSDMALIVLIVAALAEVGAYYIPWLDNLLDTIATPTATIAGTLLAGSLIVDVHPALQWTLAAILGGGTAAGTQMLTVASRAASTAMTAGIGNPIVATVEGISATLLTLLTILAPVLAAVVMVGLIALTARIVRRRHERRRRTEMVLPA